eukprot:TRINITY_DN92378_c0_g1_i1.p1 TRINITY_DN92378_c0_g1~~TRINITY_DN92378_c0_g1_i1.p1  ORF type:complete len:484 (-),score=49.04 TRINITY_DN92378_c0_g1_i1:74-1477(-)
MDKACAAVAEAALTARVEVLEREVASYKDRLQAVMGKHRDFVEQAIAVGFATLASDAGFYWFLCLVTEEVDGVTMRHQLIARGLYALLNSLLVPFLQYRLSLGCCEGETLFRDTLKLYNLSMGMIMAWAWKDLISSIISMTPWHDGREFLYRLVVAVSLTFIASSFECSPCFVRCQKKHIDGENSLLIHFVLSSSSGRLALGFAWYQLVHWPVAKLYSEAGHATGFMAQALYTFLASQLVLRFTVLQLRNEQAHAQGQAHSCRKIVMAVMASAISFVIGWAASDNLNILVFGVYSGCLSDSWSPKACPFQGNVAYAAIISVIFSYFSGLIQKKKSTAIMRRMLRRGRSLEFAEQCAIAQTNLLIKGMSLIVGWAWSNAVGTVILRVVQVLKQEESGTLPSTGIHQVDQALLYTALAILVMTAAAYCYHLFLEENRSLDDLVEGRNVQKPAETMEVLEREKSDDHVSV